MKRVVFIDRDGTIIVEPKDKQIDSLEKLDFLPGAVTGLKLLVDSGYTLVMVSNQDALGSRAYPKKAFDLVQKKIIGLLAGEGIRFDKVFICPHRRDDNCKCRKPKTGLLTKYLRDNQIDSRYTFVMGDRSTDVELAKNLGLQSVRIANYRLGKEQVAHRADFTTPDFFEACSYIARCSRSASVERVTNETSIKASVSVDGTGIHHITTGIGFFDHMLSQLSRHSRIDLALHAKGDLHIDEHHTVEDCGIILGTALRKALGSKKGIDRYGFAAPLDESLAEVVIDLSGRRYLKFSCVFRRERIGDLPTELIEDFFLAFADGLHATIHITCNGRNDHHKAEAIFKAVALALRAAVRIDPRARGVLPTTKGLL